MKNLVIVESPTKAKTIGKILGNKYKICSSMGHIIDLPRRKIGVDIDNDFNPTYVIIPGKKKTLSELKRHAKNSSVIYLATDEDREGEAISWHLKNQLQAKKADKEFLRVVFHEITPEAVKEAFSHPVEIDQNMVDAQQARRVLDRIVGYFLSPLLWKKVAKGLSAGRVQSVALKLIVTRERQIKNFKPEEYWRIEGLFKRKKAAYEEFKAELTKCDGQKIKIERLKNVEDIITELKTKEYSVYRVKKGQKRRNPQAPFITSTLQQDAFNRLKFTTRKTMMVAQQLYEGIELGDQGPIGLITYMRTDSVQIAAPALKQLRQFIEHAYGKDYLPHKPRLYKSKRSAQQAHECIRPSSIMRKPDDIRQYLSQEQFKLYELIWKRTVASQMNPAVFLTNTIDISADKYLFTASGSNLKFDGFLKVYGIETRETEQTVPELDKGESLKLLKLNPSQHFTRPPAHYSEASLVKALEEKGIGRPSTYAPIIYTLIMRNYVRREKGYLLCTDLGAKVTDILEEYFKQIMNIAFTANMEEELDKIEAGEIKWVDILKSFYTPFKKKLTFAQDNLKKEVITTNETCQLCGSPMVIKWSRSGKFLSCSTFPKCRFAKSITSGVKCPADNCDGELVMRRSKRGIFYGCSSYPKCTYITKYLPKDSANKKQDNASLDK